MPLNNNKALMRANTNTNLIKTRFLANSIKYPSLICIHGPRVQPAIYSSIGMLAPRHEFLVSGGSWQLYPWVPEAKSCRRRFPWAAQGWQIDRANSKALSRSEKR